MKFQLVEIETYFPIRFVCVNILEFSIFFNNKSKNKKYIFCFELSSRPIVDILDITVSMWEEIFLNYPRL